MTPGPSMRLDAALVARGLARSRGHARDLIGHGVVRVGGEVAGKPSRPVQHGDLVVVDAGSGAGVLDASWVSRAAGKLIGALEDLPGGGPAVEGVRAVDVGASTGGFTQVLLRRGADSVQAVDVGHDQLAPSLCVDPRVVDLSGRNVRDLTPDDLGGAVDLLVADLSFISLTLVMARLAALVREGGDLVLLVKPQFEVGRGGLDGRGVVRTGTGRRAALRAVLRSAVDEGLLLRGLVTSRTPGQDGNTEYVAWLSRPGASDVGMSWQAVSDTIDDLFRSETPG
ncbi:MAG: TlyA family RNA methyltransferase [Intrasporangiaceae bacterium]|nr:TlyA family RNA methyltransferase [Intrasporangiaceae bacterium]